MKTKYILSTLVLCLSLSSGFAQLKTALLIGIGNYPETQNTAGWHELASLNDIAHIKQALLIQGFAEEDILTLSDEGATKENIIKALTKTLPAMSQSGGYCIVHFSGHGQLIFDDNNDETDGFDEAMVPYDAPNFSQMGQYQGEKHLRDDELNAALLPLRKKLGNKGQLLVSLDACHAGTGLRANTFSTYRGTEYRLSKPSGTPTPNIVVDRAIKLFSDHPALAKVVGFYASAPYQRNHESKDENGQAIGSLSYAFAKAFATIAPSDTYENLFIRIRSIMAAKVPQQKPQAEGQLQNEVFGGRLSPIRDYFTISKWRSTTAVKANAGILHGLTEGSTVTLFQNGVQIAKGKVQRSSVTWAEVKITEGTIEENQFHRVKVVLDKQHYTNRLKIYLGENIPGDYQKQLEDYIQYSDAFTFGISTPDISICYDVVGSKPFHAYASNGLRIAAASSAKRLWNGLMKYQAANFLRQLEAQTPTYKAKLELVSPENLPQLNGTYLFKENQEFRIKISNKGQDRLYYTVVAVNPVHDIGVIVPYCDENLGYDGLLPEDLFLDPGQQATYDFDYVASKPFGMDFIKLVSSPSPIDLSYVVTRGIRGNIDCESPFCPLFAALYHQEETRGTADLVLPTGQVNIETVIMITEE